MVSGKDLIADIDNYKLAKKEFAFWWLGQHSFIVKIKSATIYIDPYLSDDPDRKVPSILKAEEVTNAVLVLGSHDHDDHIDRNAWPQLASASPKAMFVVPEILRQELSGSLGIPSERFVGLTDGESVDLNNIKITAVAAAHEFLDKDEGVGLYPYLGYIIESDGCAIYHSGDTCIYEGLQTKLSKWNFDTAFLPINGRDARRFAAGCIGNMTYQEAADLAGTLKPALTVPAHYDMFEGNTEDPQLFVDYMNVKYPNLKVCVCNYGERIVVK